MDEPRPALSPQIDRPIQFRLSTIFMLTLVATILAAFLSPRGSDLMLAGACTVVVSSMFGAIVGSFRPPLVDRIFWGMIVAAMMQAVSAEVVLLDRATGIYVWPIVAGFSAVIAAGRSNLYLRMVASAGIAGLIITVYIFSLHTTPSVIISYIACAGIGGALLTIMVDATRWIENRLHIPQPVIGLLLVLGGIVFSLLASRMIPGW